MALEACQSVDHDFLGPGEIEQPAFKGKPVDDSVAVISSENVGK